MADPTMQDLHSLVKDDYAEHDVLGVYKTFKGMRDRIQLSANSRSGCFQLYGIPAYLPETFASYIGEKNGQFCSLEIGIGVGPECRPSFYFKKVSDDDIYTNLNLIYREILKGLRPLLRVPDGVNTPSGAG